MRVFLPLCAALSPAVAFLGACAGAGVSRDAGSSAVRDFLEMYNATEQRIAAIANESKWKAATDVGPQSAAELMGAERALAAFRGSRHVIEKAKNFLQNRQALTTLEFQQLDMILLKAAEAPGTIPEIVDRRMKAEARLESALESFPYCAASNGGKCLKATSLAEIEEILLKSRNLNERKRMWEASREPGRQLEADLAEVRDLRNRVAVELGYSSYFHLQVADYGMSVSEMMQLADQILQDLRPLYEQLHLWTRRRLAARYQQPVPGRIPAHWLPENWGQRWPGLIENADFSGALHGRTPDWIIKQAERFYMSLGWEALPKTFWQRSDLYALPGGAQRKKSNHASCWHIDLDRDVRCLMSVTPSLDWFLAGHRELGRVYYYLAYSNPRVPVVLRAGANRAFHEAVADLMAGAAQQPAYLKATGILRQEGVPAQTARLLAEALEGAIVLVPFAAGTMTHFEYELYERRIPPDVFNRRWWEFARRHQGIEPPAPRGEEFCDACANRAIIADPAQYYDHAIALLVKYQLHDYIARKILGQDPRDCNYYGSKEAGKWLWEILSLGATVDWRQLLKEKTGEDLSSRALREYFRPLTEYLLKENGGQSGSWE